MPSKTPSHWVGAAICLIALVATIPAQSPGRRGVIVSEVHHQSVGDGLPTYIELLNLDPMNSVDLAGAILEIRGPGGGVAGSVTLQSANIPSFSSSVNAGGSTTPGTGTMTVVAPGGGQISNPVEQVIVAPSLFTGSSVLNPFVPWTICLSVPGPAGSVFVDRVQLNGLASGSCTIGGAWNGPPLNYAGGAVIRGYRVDSDTAHDFISYPSNGSPPPPDNPAYQGPPVGASPTVVNPEMSRVTGFFFGDQGSNPGAPGIPFFQPTVVPPGSAFGSVSGAGASVGAVSQPLLINTINNPLPQTVAWVQFKFHPYQSAVRQIDPVFDPLIPTGQLVMQTTITGQGPFLGHQPTGPNVPPVSPGGMTWELTVPSTAPNGTNGVLNIDMGPLEQADIGFQLFQPQGATSPHERRLRIERILTDFTTDEAATGSGELSPVQFDILPSEGDLWCEMILYDGNGFSYRGKVRNWPNNPLNCSTPNLGIGSNAIGNLDIIALCFDQLAELYLLPSLTPASTTGSGPFFGIIPDSLTFGFLGLPFGFEPAHVQTTVDGLYFYSITDPSLSTMSFDMVAVQWGEANLTGFGFDQASPAVNITIQ